MRCIGSVYAKGLGVPVDYGEAMKWYRWAAETGDPTSMYALAVLYGEGKLVAQDELSPNFGDGLKDQAAAWA